MFEESKLNEDEKSKNTPHESHEDEKNHIHRIIEIIDIFDNVDNLDNVNNKELSHIEAPLEEAKVESPKQIFEQSHPVSQDKLISEGAHGI
jgi:hypothetical protein